MTVRNQLARELHDQLGHTIIMTLSSIDRIEKDNIDEQRWLKLDELMVSVSDLLQRSLPDKKVTDEINQHKISTYGVAAILKDLQSDSIQAGIEVEFDIQGSSEKIPASHFHDINQI